MALCLPLLLLVVVEGVLRGIGYGYPTGYFLSGQVGGRKVWLENAQFTRRYFPGGLARSPQPVVLEAVKPAGACRVFVFGESAAMGDPAPAYGFARMLRVLLEERDPGRRYEVANVAVTAINSHVIRQIARDCAAREGDIWVVYMGNNEVIGPYGAGTVFGSQTPSLGFIRASLALKATRLGQALESVGQWLRGRNGRSRWEGMEMFLDQQVAQEDPRMSVVYGHYRENLKEIVATGRRAGARVMVCNVVVNLKDCPPFASKHRTGLAGSDLENWNRLYQAGVAAEAAGDRVGALGQYQAAARIDDRYAELQYRMGQVFLGLGRREEARGCFGLAGDLDTLRFRADSRLNGMVREVAEGWGGGGVLFVDLAGACAARSRDGLVGGECLYEHVHLNAAGNYWVARALAGGVEGLLAGGSAGTDSGRGAWLTLEQCTARLAMTAWDERRVLEEMLARVRLAPFSNQLDHEKREGLWESRMRELDGVLGAGGVEAGVGLYAAALKRWPEDWELRENYARFLQAHGRQAKAEEQWRKVVALVPHYAPGYYSLGNAMDVQGRSAEALGCFQKALQLRPGSVEARNGLGLALENLGRMEEARREYEGVIGQRPDFVQARINLGQLLVRMKREQEAMEQYQEALRLNSNSVAARVNLGKLLSGQGRKEEAMKQYAEALRLQPNHAVAHYNLGNALTGRDDRAALEHYAAAVRAQPDFAAARYELGLGLARAGREAEALAELEEAVRLQPGFAEGRLNLGVALAKAGRYAEAIVQFKECLMLAPGHEAAARYLEQARGRLGRGE